MAFFSIFSGVLGGLTPKLWAPLKPAHHDGSFGSLESQIGHMVMEILTVDQNGVEQTDE